jgi:hypothetical protein
LYSCETATVANSPAVAAKAAILVKRICFLL